MNLEQEAINPDHHATNMVTVRTSSPPQRSEAERKEYWVPLARVEHQLAAMTLQTRGAPIEIPQADEGTSWTEVKLRHHRSNIPPRRQRASMTPRTTPTRRQPDPNRRCLPPRFVPEPEGDAPFPRTGRLLPTLGEFLPKGWGQTMSKMNKGETVPIPSSNVATYNETLAPRGSSSQDLDEVYTPQGSAGLDLDEACAPREQEMVQAESEPFNKAVGAFPLGAALEPSNKTDPIDSFDIVMPFGLKNAGATCQRAMTRVLDDSDQ